MAKLGTARVPGVGRVDVFNISTWISVFLGVLSLVVVWGLANNAWRWIQAQTGRVTNNAGGGTAPREGERYSGKVVLFR